MNNILALALLIIGGVLISLGVTASESLSSDISRFFTGSPTDKSVWLLIGGVVCVLAGLLGLSSRWKA